MLGAWENAGQERPPPIAIAGFLKNIRTLTSIHVPAIFIADTEGCP